MIVEALFSIGGLITLAYLLSIKEEDGNDRSEEKSYCNPENRAENRIFRNGGVCDRVDGENNETNDNTEKERY